MVTTFNIVDKDGTIWARQVQSMTLIKVASYLLKSQDPGAFYVDTFEGDRPGYRSSLIDFCKKRNIT